MQELTLTDLMDVSTLQAVQDAFSKMTGMAALTADADGKAVTKGTNFTDYCMKYTRVCEKGRQRCEQCDKYGAEMTMKNGKATTYVCHSGLVDFAAPIIAEEHLIGCFIGGQVLIEEPDKEAIRAIAEDLGIPFAEYWEAIKKIPILNKEQVDAAAEFLHKVASILSEMAYSRYMVFKANTEIERAANMKTDFLANMSHEIRTPMNAVIGMAEIALRENLPPIARDCITQIRSSGSALLNIINDILDFSKIESGKMDIQPIEYEPLSVFHDVVNILMTRIEGKEVELLLSANTKIPKMLYGDNLRIRQVLLNIANNAVKFTRRGRVSILVDFEKLDEERIQMKIEVQDTGIGIKEADLSRLFQSFQQVDSKRNRNIEGTGLGLAISKRLLDLMGGKIHVESVYEKGSTFFFELPQKVIDWEPSIVVRDAEHVAAIGYFNNLFLARQFFSDTGRLGVLSMALTSSDRFEELLENYNEELIGKRIYLFFDEKSCDEIIEHIIVQYPEIMAVKIVEFSSTEKSSIPNFRIIRKPMSTIQTAMAFNDEEIHFIDELKSFEFDFTAPKAEILLVDDNEINLTVAEGLLQPLKMRITKATSGKMALELIDKKLFDIIFMDHMMPELDGVETTRIIRRLHPKYNHVPIIALTANAVSGTKEMFLAEGMNDFVAKPIEVRTIVSKIRQWLPEDKIEKGHAVVPVSEKRETKRLVIGDLDTDAARKMIGNDELYFSILKEYYRFIQTKAVKIKELQQKKDWHDYTIEVHALKSASRQIGAMELANLAALLEKAGREQDVDTILQQTDIMLQKYVGYVDLLRPFCTEEEKPSDRIAADPGETVKLLNRLGEAVENLDMDEMEAAIVEMDKYDFHDTQQEYFERIKTAVANLDVEVCEELLIQWRDLLHV